jgi:hypothetical protein
VNYYEADARLLTQLHTGCTGKFLTKEHIEFSLTSQEVRTIFAHVENNKITDDKIKSNKKKCCLNPEMLCCPFDLQDFLNIGVEI